VITPAENNSTTDGTMPAVRYPVALLTSALVLTVVAFAAFGWVIFDPSHAAKIARDQATRMALTIGALTILTISFAAWLSVLRGRQRWRIDLEQAVSERRQAEEALRRARNELEVRIAQHTAELGKTNQALQAEITERQQAETALRESERQYQSLTENSPVGIFRTDSNGQTTYVNARWCELTGLSVEETLGEGWLRAIHPEDREALIRGWREASTAQGISLTDYRLLRRDGSVTWVLGRATPDKDAAGRLVGYVGTIMDITARKRAEEALLQSEEQFRAMFELASVGIAQADPRTGRWLRVNPKMCEITGYSAAELLQMRVSEITHPEDRAQDWEKFEQVVRGESPDYRMEKRYLRKDGTVAWVNVNMTVIRDAAGQPTRTMTTIEDITERKRAEETIRRERDFSQASLDSLPGLFYLFDDQGRFLRWNKNLERVSGYSADELSRMTPLDLLGETDKGRSADGMQRVFQTGEATMEVDFLSKDQTKIPFLFTGKLSHLDQKSCVMGMGIDITERKRAEEALRASQQITEGIINAIPVRVFWKDKNLVFLGCNAVFARDAGFGDPKDIIGKDDYQMEWHDQAEAYRKDDRQTIESGNSKFNIEESQTTPDGKTITVLTSKIPLRNSTGQISGVLGTYVDITERKLAEAALEKVNQELVVASRQAGMAEVATSVLHNVGNVLNSVGVSATLVANQVRHTKAGNIAKLAALFDEHQADLAKFLTQDPRGQTVPAYLGSLVESLAAEQTTLLAELAYLRKNIEHIKDIVAMQQANARIVGATATISIPDLLEEALRIDADALARYDVTTIRDYQACPAITTDKHKVLQILINLVRNAELACVDSGRTDKQITVRTTSDDRSVKTAISDNGVGIPAENLTRIFNHGFTTRKTGHGFALHSSALAAQELGGALTVQSDGPGRGATFTLELPCDAGKTHP